MDLSKIRIPESNLNKKIEDISEQLRKDMGIGYAMEKELEKLADYNVDIGSAMEKELEQIRKLTVPNLGIGHAMEKEIERARKLGEMMAGPAVQFAEAMGNSSARLTRSIEGINDLGLHPNVLNSIQEQFKFIDDFQSQLRGFAELDEGLAAAMNMGVSNIGSLESTLPTLQQIQSIPLEDSFRKELDEVSDQVLDESEVSKFFKRLFIYFSDKASEFPDSPTARLGLMVAVISLYYQIQIFQLSLKTSNESKKYHQESITALNEVNQNIGELSNKLIPMMQDLVTIKRECPIRSRPIAKSDTLMRGIKGQPIEIIDSQNRWYQIHYFDVADSTTKLGYIYKGHVQ